VVSQASSHHAQVGISAPSKPGLLGGAGDLGEIADRHGPHAGGGADANAVTAANEMTAVAVGGQEPMRGQGFLDTT